MPDYIYTWLCGIYKIYAIDLNSIFVAIMQQMLCDIDTYLIFIKTLSHGT